MGRTLLIGHPGVSWREWFKEHRGNRDLLCLDPTEGHLGPPARFVLLRDQRPVYQRFYGSLDPQRGPHVLLAALAESLPLAGEDALVQLFSYRSTPLLRQLVQLVSQVVQPTTIAMATETPLDKDGFPVGPEEIELGKAFPPLVQQASRKAQWMKLLEVCSDQEVDLRQVTIEGARLGSGENVTRHVSSLMIVHAEKCGNSLLLVAEEDLDEGTIGRALDVTHSFRAHVVSPEIYRHLTCSFARANGEDFGFGIVTEIDFESFRAKVLCSAIPPAPLMILRLGSLKVDPQGNELGELKPWQA